MDPAPYAGQGEIPAEPIEGLIDDPQQQKIVFKTPLEEGAYRAVKRLKDFKPFKLKEPTKLEVEFQHTGMADAAEMTPFSSRVNGLSLMFEGSFLESYRALQTMIRHAVSQR